MSKNQGRKSFFSYLLGSMILYWGPFLSFFSVSIFICLRISVPQTLTFPATYIKHCVRSRYVYSLGQASSYDFSVDLCRWPLSLEPGSFSQDILFHELYCFSYYLFILFIWPRTAVTHGLKRGRVLNAFLRTCRLVKCTVIELS